MSEPGNWGEWAGEKLWEYREQFLAYIKGLFKWLFGPSQTPGQSDDRSILFLGAGGVGKSTLGKILSGEYDLLFDLPGNYDESLFEETYPLGGPGGVSIVVPPGQEHRRPTTWDGLFANLAAGKFRGVVHVVAHGYHNHTLGTNASYQDHPLFKGLTPPRRKEDFLTQFVQQRRAEEVAIMQQIAPHLTSCPGSIWFLTVVTKQDLWYADQVEVEDFYRNQVYGNIITEIHNRRGSSNFRHDLTLASLVISNFVSGNNEMLRPNSAGYDHNLHAQSLRRLFATLDSLRMWEAQR